MDNEEIKELLKELKETSDESTAVKSRVVKIHFDTRREAEERAKEKEKARQEAERQRLEKEEEEKKKQEALSREAEEKTEAIVNEAKAEASAAFSPDFSADIDRLQKEEPAEEPEKPNDTDLKLNWKPISIMRSISAAHGRKTADDDARKEDQKNTDQAEEEETEEDTDQEQESLQSRIFGGLRRGMNGLLTRIARQDEEEEKEERGIRTPSDVEDGEDSDEITDEDDSFDDEDTFSGLDQEEGLADFEQEQGNGFPDLDQNDGDLLTDEDGPHAVPASPEVEMREIKSPEKEEKDGEDDWKKRMEQPPRFNLRHVKIPDIPVRKWVKPAENTSDENTSDGKEMQPGRTKASPDESRAETVQPEEPLPAAPQQEEAQQTEFQPEELQPEGFQTEGLQPEELQPGGPQSGEPRTEQLQQELVQPKAPDQTTAKDLSKDDFESDEADFRSSPDRRSEKISAREQQPEKKLSDLLGRFLKKDKKPEALSEAQAAAEAGPSVQEQPQISQPDAAPQIQTAMPQTTQTSPAPQTQTAVPQTTQASAAPQAKAAAAPQTQTAVLQTEKVPQEGAESSGRQSIEVVNLNENANHKQVEVIQLEKNQTGPLPELSGNGSGSKRQRSQAAGKTAAAGAAVFLQGLSGKIAGAVRKRSDKAAGQPSVNDILNREPETGEKTAEDSISPRRKLITTGALIAVGVILVIILIIWAVSSGSSGSASSTGSGVTADEGLTVRIRQQPMSYVKEGDVTLSIQVPKMIQSITVDDKAVEFEGDKKTEITWHAESSQLKLMVVSTDKVRSATIKLAYIDSEAPTISVSTKGNMVTLSAKDDSSGVSGIYYGTCGPFSDVPLYQKYMQPFEEDENAVYYWYAVDNAGNSTVPVSGTFTEAESISFDKESYQIYPDHPVTVTASVKPRNAFVNNLTYSSSDEKVFKVEQGNVLVPVGEGDAVVTASADGLDPAQAKVTVTNAKTVTISAVGDCTLGTDPSLAADTSFNAFQIVNGDQYFFKNIKGILGQDDATFANFEGTLTTSDQRENKKFTFKGDPAYTNILKDGSIDVVTLANNHSGDYGDQGLADTQQNLTDAGIDWCSGDTIAYKDLNGIKCAFIGIYAVENGLDTLDQVKSAVQEAKNESAQIIVVYFHWNSELVEAPNDDMVTLGHAAVDAGASLVVGSHSHLVSGIEKYNGVYIVYGLGNFCFGGNLHPNDYDSMIFRQTFTVSGSGIADDDNIGIIPVSISSDQGYNNYQPTPVSGDAASRIMGKIDQRSAQFGSEWDKYMIDGTAMETESTDNAQTDAGRQGSSEEQTEAESAA